MAKKFIRGLYEIKDKINNLDKFVKAVETIKSGLCDKLEKDNIIVYRCGKIIRVDIKWEQR